VAGVRGTRPRLPLCGNARDAAALRRFRSWDLWPCGSPTARPPSGPEDHNAPMWTALLLAQTDLLGLRSKHRPTIEQTDLAQAETN
jgi:hypothetical protein